MSDVEKLILAKATDASKCSQLKKIGEGCYGKVYLAKKKIKRNTVKHTERSSIVLNFLLSVLTRCRIIKDTKTIKFALKIVHNIGSKHQNPSENVLLDALEEAQLFEELRHKSIIQLWNWHSLFDGNKLIAVSMEFEFLPINMMESLNVARYGTDTSIVKVIKQIGAGIAYLHDKRISHNDIKLENIMLSFKGRIPTRSKMISIDSKKVQFKLIDFGLCKRYPANCVLTKTIEYNSWGTESYMTPAKLYTAVTKDSRDGHNPFSSDIYAFGICVLSCIAKMSMFDFLILVNKGEEHFAEEFFRFVQKFKAFDCIRDKPNLFKIIELMTKNDDEERPTMADLLDWFDYIHI